MNQYRVNAVAFTVSRICCGSHTFEQIPLLIMTRRHPGHDVHRRQGEWFDACI